MKLIKLFILFAFLGTNIIAQIEFDLSGYVVEMPFYQKLHNSYAEKYNVAEGSFFNLNRVRIKPVIYLTDNTRINIAYEAAGVYNVKSDVNFSSAQGRTKTQLVDLSGSVINKTHYSMHHFIDRLYIKQRFDFGNLIVGRQRISWGSGRVWNPTDVFNPLNPANFAKIEKDGADALTLNYYIGSFTDLQFVVNPTEKIGKTNFALRYRTNMDEYDYIIIGGLFNEQAMFGIDVTGNLYGAGIRFEGISRFDETKDMLVNSNFIAGIDYQFTPNLYGVFEYQFNGVGNNNKLNYDIENLLKANIINVAKNYTHFGVQYKLLPILLLSVSTTQNMNDGSGLNTLGLNYSGFDEWLINFGTQVTTGETLSEYWYYGNAYYLKIDYYF